LEHFEIKAASFNFSQYRPLGRSFDILWNNNCLPIRKVKIVAFRGSEEEKIAQTNWESCLDNFTSMACNVPKDNVEQKKQC